MKLSRTNGRGLATTAPYQGLGAGSGSKPLHIREIEDLRWTTALRRLASRLVPAETVQTHKILVTLAERPHPFPSRTRKLSSPAPKILRGQPFGKIGRRQGFCVNGQFAVAIATLGLPSRAGRGSLDSHFGELVRRRRRSPRPSGWVGPDVQSGHWRATSPA